MKQDDMLLCVIAFILGFVISRMMGGNGMCVGGQVISAGVASNFQPNTMVGQTVRDLVWVVVQVVLTI